MKKNIKILLILLFAFIFFGLTKNVEANSINKISMDIYVDNQGNANITEVWSCTASSGTEIYHPYYNLGNSKIKDLSVSEGNNTYETLSSWNSSGSLNSKANKCGINTISNGIELCWGISSYGSHTYTVKYKITNFVSNLTDSQMIYWTLIPYDFSSSIGNVYIKIHTDFNIADSVGVWGYGNYGGTAYVYDGYIEMQSSGSLSTSEYMTILVQFPAGTFNATNNLNNNFSYYHNMAEEGAVSYKGNTSSSNNSKNFVATLFFTILRIIFSPFGIFIFIAIITRLVAKPTVFNFGSGKKKFLFSKDTPYFRDIPCNKDLLKAYFIAYKYGIIKNKTDILGAIILKWLKDSIIKIEKRDINSLLKKEDTVVILNETNPELITNSREKELFKMLYDASKDGILESKEFERWCNSRYSTILSWFDKIIKEEELKLINEDYITVNEVVKFKLFKHTEHTSTPKLDQEAQNLYGLKKYLNDYTLIKDREAIEVTLFEEYLVYAQMMGIAKKVAQQFKDLYPEIIEQSNFNSFDNIIFINMCATRGISQANTARSRAESYSSGGGGFSAGGGGGGSFGGGGGGGGFR